MHFELSGDEEVLRETTERFLADQVPPDELRRLRDDPAGFDAGFWRRGCELGWTSLLVAAEAGGGSISGRGLVDLTLVAHEFGRHAAPGPLVATNVVAAALSHAATAPDVVAGLLDGSVIATWCWAEGPPDDGLGDRTVTIRPDGAELVIDGEKRPVEHAGQADHLLVTGRTSEGLTQVLVPTATPGVSVREMKGTDLTRRYAAVRFDQVRVPVETAVGGVGEAGNDVERQLRQALVIQNAETVGAMEAGFDMTVEWAFDRYSFGRPLASYQALKHRFADMKTWLDGSHAISDRAAIAVADEADDAGELVSAATAFIGDYGLELLHECVQLHGGIGLTFEHDLHFFLRRATTARALFGTPAEHRLRVADAVVERERAA